MKKLFSCLNFLKNKVKKFSNNIAFKKIITLPLLIKCYLITVIFAFAFCLFCFFYDTTLYATGLMYREEITLAESEKYTFFNLEKTGESTLRSKSHDCYMLLNLSQPVRRVELFADYRTNNSERDLYYHFPTFDFSQNMRTWPTLSASGENYNYKLPLFAWKNIRLDLLSFENKEIELEKIIINAPLAPWEYFVPNLWEIFWWLFLSPVIVLIISLLPQKTFQRKFFAF